MTSRRLVKHAFQALPYRDVTAAWGSRSGVDLSFAARCPAFGTVSIHVAQSSRMAKVLHSPICTFFAGQNFFSISYKRSAIPSSSTT